MPKAHFIDARHHFIYRKATSFVYVRKMKYGLTAVMKSASQVPLKEVMADINEKTSFNVRGC